MFDQFESVAFGVEIECIPEQTNGRAARTNGEVSCALEASFVKKGYPVANRIGNSSSWDKYHQWKIVTDESISAYSGLELATPILLGTPESFEQIRYVCGLLQANKLTTNQRCGLHVHIGMPRDTKPQVLKDLIRLYHCYEDVIDSLMPEARRTSINRYCRSVRSNDIQQILAANSLNDVIHKYGGADAKHVKMNVASINGHGTIEFRHHPGTVFYSKIEYWVKTCMRMVLCAQHGLPSWVMPKVKLENPYRDDTKMAEVFDLLLRHKKGVTNEDICELTGWSSFSINDFLTKTQEKMGIELSVDRQYDGRRMFFRILQPTFTLKTFTDLLGHTPLEIDYLQRRLNHFKEG